MSTARTAQAAAPADSARQPREPWWKVGMVWLVIGGPLVVVVAGIATLVIAIRNPDPVLISAPVSDPSQRPAVQGRNHAATPPSR